METQSQDIVTRLHRWAISTDSVPASDLMDEAADEIERLRSRPCPYVTGRTTQYCTLTPLALTDEERESLAYYIGTGGPHVVDVTLAGLLSRTGPPVAARDMTPERVHETTETRQIAYE